MRRFLLATALAACAASGTALAVDGELDPSFGTDAEFPGYGFYANPNGAVNFSLDIIGAVAQRNDGKIWAVGKMKSPGAYRLSLYRVGANGYPDTDFGDLGLRTVVGPCTDFTIADAKLDSQQRLVVVANGCADFTVYRFLPNGDLDVSLAGSGVLSVPFNLGGANNDFSQKLVIGANDDIIVAGTVNSASTTQLGVVRYTAAGEPAPGFGAAGKVQIAFEWSVPEIRGISGLHLTGDGRIVIPGAISQSSQAVSDKKQFVVRLLGNGSLDPSFGNVSAGISKVALKGSLGVSQSPWVSGSLLESNGSVIQVGAIVSNQANSASDIFLLRWRPDGQPDTSIGAFGVRQYALDFAGPNPADPAYNWESADSILRQPNGDYIISASSNIGPDSAVALLRLKRNFNIDPRFGNGGKIQHLVQVAVQGDHGLYAGKLLLQAGRLIGAGSVTTGINGRVQTMMGVQHDTVFADTFD